MSWAIFSMVAAGECAARGVQRVARPAGRSRGGCWWRVLVALRRGAHAGAGRAPAAARVRSTPRRPDPMSSFHPLGPVHAVHARVINATGQPRGISLPLFEGEDGLPLGVQLVGRPAHGRERRCWRSAAQLAEATTVGRWRWPVRGRGRPSSRSLARLTPRWSASARTAHGLRPASPWARLPAAARRRRRRAASSGTLHELGLVPRRERALVAHTSPPVQPQRAREDRRAGTRQERARPRRSRAEAPSRTMSAWRERLRARRARSAAGPRRSGVRRAAITHVGRVVGPDRLVDGRGRVPASGHGRRPGPGARGASASGSAGRVDDRGREHRRVEMRASRTACSARALARRKRALAVRWRRRARRRTRSAAAPARCGGVRRRARWRCR